MPVDTNPYILNTYKWNGAFYWRCIEGQWNILLAVYLIIGNIF